MRKAKIVPSSDETGTAKLRCWQDTKGDLHLASNPGGAQELIQAIDALTKSAKATSVTLALLDVNPFPKSKGRAWSHIEFFGIGKSFSKLRLDRVDDPTELVRLYAHKADAETAQICVAKGFLSEFLELCHQMAMGRYDFGIGGRQRDTSIREWRKLTVLDKESARLWFWGNSLVR